MIIIVVWGNYSLNIKQLGLGRRLLLLENIGFSGKDSNTLKPLKQHLLWDYFEEKHVVIYQCH